MSKYINLACHPHPLTLREGTGSTFKCALCHCHGYGSLYSCSECSSYQIHDSCTECPRSMSFFGHPQHSLALQPEIAGDSGRCCALCTYCIHGIHYGCRACGLFQHPVCATLPPSAISPAHPQHFVTLIPDVGNGHKCTGCSTGLHVWHYACAPCGVRLHPWCLLGNGDKDGKSPLCIRDVHPSSDP